MTKQTEPPVMDVADAIRAHHAELAANVAAGAAAVRDAAERLQGTAQAREKFVGYLVTEVLPHAAAEEGTLYAAGGLLTATQLLVRAMIEEHRLLENLVSDLGVSRTPSETVAVAASIRTLFDAHLAKENDVLLPALHSAGVDLALLVEGMHEVLGDVSRADSGCGCGGCGCGGHSAGSEVLDVRPLPRGLRHEEVFRAVGRLSPGESVVVINDHDPKRLHNQLDAEHPGKVSWAYLEEGPEVWQVRVALLADSPATP